MPRPAKTPWRCGAQESKSQSLMCAQWPQILLVRNTWLYKPATNCSGALLFKDICSLSRAELGGQTSVPDTGKLRKVQASAKLTQNVLAWSLMHALASGI